MKKLLATLMAVMLTTVMAVNVAVLADGEENAAQQNEQSADQGTDTTSAQEPVDTSDVKTYLVIDFTSDDKVVVNQSLSGSKESIDYLQGLYSQSGYDIKSEEKDGKYIMSMPETELTLENIRNSGLEVIEDKGLFSTKKTYVYLVGDVSSGSSDDAAEEVGSIVLKANGIISYTNADKVSGGAEMKLISGQNGSFIVMTNVINWVGILLIVLIVLAIAVIIALIVITKSRKKNAAKAEDDTAGGEGTDDILAQLTSADISDAPAEETSAEETADTADTEAVADETPAEAETEEVPADGEETDKEQ